MVINNYNNNIGNCWLYCCSCATTAAPLTTISTFISAFKQQQNFIAELKSEMVVSSTSSNAIGTAYFQLELESNNKINYNLTATDLDSVKAAHIHIGKEGANDPIIVIYTNLFPQKSVRQNSVSTR
jgi:hypothetical protein